MSLGNGVCYDTWFKLQRVYPPKLGDPGLRSSDLRWHAVAGSGDGGPTVYTAQPGMVQDSLWWTILSSLCTC